MKKGLTHTLPQVSVAVSASQRSKTQLGTSLSGYRYFVHAWYRYIRLALRDSQFPVQRKRRRRQRQDDEEAVEPRVKLVLPKASSCIVASLPFFILPLAAVASCSLFQNTSSYRRRPQHPTREPARTESETRRPDIYFCFSW